MVEVCRSRTGILYDEEPQGEGLPHAQQPNSMSLTCAAFTLERPYPISAVSAFLHERPRTISTVSAWKRSCQEEDLHHLSCVWLREVMPGGGTLQSSKLAPQVFKCIATMAGLRR